MSNVPTSPHTIVKLRKSSVKMHANTKEPLEGKSMRVTDIFGNEKEVPYTVESLALNLGEKGIASIRICTGKEGSIPNRIFEIGPHD